MARASSMLRSHISRRAFSTLALVTAVLLFAVLPARVQEDTTIQFAAFGDFGLAGAGELEVSNLVKSWDPDFVVVLGDNNYPLGAASTIDANIGQYYSEFIAPYQGTYGPGGTENRFFPALGNHDWGDGFVDPPPIQAHYDYFALPGNERYYDVVKGPVHLFVLDSDTHEPDGVSASSVQAQWLQAGLAASTARWKVVAFHHPPYTSGNRPPDTYMRWPFREWGATAVLTAHHHHYESLLVANTPYYISGLGGNGRGGFSFPVPETRLRYSDTYGSLRVTATDERILFEFVATSGAIVDSHAIDAPAAPGAAFNLVTKGIPTGRIDLWWSDSASDETGFVIERSDDGVNFLEIATVGPDVTSYTDQTVNPTPTAYRYRVLAQTPGAQAYSNVALGTTVPPPPDAPTAQVEATSTTSARISWTDVPSEEGYNVYRQVQGVFIHIANVSAETHQFTDTGRLPGTQYAYVVRAVNAGGESPSSNQVDVTLGQLAAPADLTAVATSSRDVTLQWTDATQGENYIKVLRSTNGTSFGVVAWAPANSTTYVDSGRTANTTYWYKLQAYENGGGTSPYSNTVTVTTPEVGSAPAPASGLTAGAASTTSISLAWTDNSTTESGFRIERARDGAFSVAATVGANVTSHTNGGLLENTTYSYRVVAFNSDGSAAPSNVATATTSSSLSAPTGLTATAQSAYKVVLNWTDTTTTEAGFKVYRATDGGAFSLLGSVGSNVTTYTNGSAQPATTYQYRVVAVTASGAASPPSNVVTVTTPSVPASPANLTATAVSSTRINLAWQDLSNDETHFKVERSTNGNSFSTLSWPPANTTTFVDNNRQPNTTYYYRVSSHNANGTSAPSNVATATTP